MPELLFELFSEEIPARMQAKAAEDLRRLVGDALIERGITFEGAKAFATPRRIALHVAGLPQRQPDTKEERKGPRVGAPEGALQGFVKSAGLSSIGEAKIVSDGKKGEMYVAIIEKPGRLTIDVLAEVLPAAVRAFPWPKSMRWGVASAPEESPWGGLNARGAQALRWVRPLQSIVATFGPETEDPEIVRFEIDGIAAGNVTQGHRFLAPQAFAVRRLDDYAQKLEAAKVVLDRERRKDIIRAEAQTLAFAQGLDLVEDEGLLDEVAGLVEWPVVLMGGFDAAFLDVPDAVIRATIRANQKCFVLRNPATGRLTNKFLLTSNIVATDGGKTIVDGNERVIRARLSDALYFWKTDQNPLPDAPLYGTPAEGLGLDLAKPLDQRMGKLAHLDVVFHEKLGTQGQRVQRIAALAAELAPIVGADAALARRAAVLAKADLMTEVVGEFPELQGFMGRVYAEKQGEHPSVCAAIEDHYKPLGPSDRVPTDKVAIAVALADKLDTLVGFWAIDEKPTGSKDPYALRRAALGVIRLVVENGLRLPLAHSGIAGALVWLEAQRGGARLLDKTALASELMEFFHDRLKVMLRDQGARHDLVDAVLSDHAAGQGAAAPAADDLLLVTRRVEALGRFLTSEDGANLLAGYRRAANILRAEEKKAKDKNEDAGAFAGGVDAHLLADPREKLLHDMIGLAGAGVHEAVAREDFEKAMSVLATLRPAVDAFFEHVIVNAEEAALRLNRLRLLGELRATCHLVADFSAISGG